MAEDQNNEPENKKDDENDPYKFFKFAGPEDNKDDKKNSDGKKKKLEVEEDYSTQPKEILEEIR